MISHRANSQRKPSAGQPRSRCTLEWAVRPPFGYNGYRPCSNDWIASPKTVNTPIANVPAKKATVPRWRVVSMLCDEALVTFELIRPGVNVVLLCSIEQLSAPTEITSMGPSTHRKTSNIPIEREKDFSGVGRPYTAEVSRRPYPPMVLRIPVYAYRLRVDQYRPFSPISAMGRSAHSPCSSTVVPPHGV